MTYNFSFPPSYQIFHKEYLPEWQYRSQVSTLLAKQKNRRSLWDIEKKEKTKISQSPTQNKKI